MKKNECTTVELGTGVMNVYDFGTAKLHTYKTNDLIDDEVFVVEKNGRGFVIEYPCFFANIEELTRYIADAGIEIEGIVAAYHMAGATFLPNVPVYATAEADTYGHEGGGKALIDGFAQAFGEAFDASIPQVTNRIEGDTLELAGVTMKIVATPTPSTSRFPSSTWSTPTCSATTATPSSPVRDTPMPSSLS